MSRNRDLDPMTEVIPRLTSGEIRDITRCLPRPNSVWTVGDSIFEVYRVKNLLEPAWPSEALRKLLIHARGSYYVYGDRSPLDEYDTKAAPYLVRVRYPFSDSASGKICLLEEWLSDRLVPCSGEPAGGGELEYFIYDEQHLDRWLQENYFKPDENYFDYTFSSNRMCAISPYFQDPGEEGSGVKIPTRQAYTAICYTLMRYHFLADHLLDSGVRYKTSILRSKVIERSMMVEASGRILTVEFTPAYRFLGLDDPRLVRIDRKAHGGAPYQFPGYFFDMDQLVSLLRKLLNDGKITEETLVRYLKDGTVVREILGAKPVRLEMLRDIGGLLSEKSTITGSSISGDELRMMIDKEVSDGPEFKISTIETLRNNCNEILGALGAIKQS